MNVQLIAGDVLKFKQWTRSDRLRMVFLAIVLTTSFAGPALAASNGTAASQTALTVSTDNSGAKTKATLTAHVTAMSGMEVPSGVVNFRSGGLDLGSAIVDGEGNAGLTTNNLPAGNHQIIAVYQGDSNYRNSISGSSQVQANASTVAGFTISASPTTLSIPAGTFATSQLTITPVNGFSAYVSLSCSGLPVGSSCTFSPTAVLASCSGTTCTPGLSSMQIQTIATSGPQSSNRQGAESGMPLYAFAVPAFFAFTGGLAGFRKRKYRALWNVALLLAVLLPAALAITACNPRYNYLNHGPSPTTGTPLGTYTVTVNSVSTTGSEITTPPTSPQLTVTVTAP